MKILIVKMIFTILLLVDCTMKEINVHNVHDFIMFVSNQRGPPDIVDIKVYIDNRLVVDSNFRYDPHGWKKFHYWLEEGIHEMRVESILGNVKEIRKFNTEGKTYAVISYWNTAEGQHFGIRITSYPPVFL